MTGQLRRRVGVTAVTAMIQRAPAAMVPAPAQVLHPAAVVATKNIAAAAAPEAKEAMAVVATANDGQHGGVLETGLWL